MKQDELYTAPSYTLHHHLRGSITLFYCILPYNSERRIFNRIFIKLQVKVKDK